MTRTVAEKTMPLLTKSVSDIAHEESRIANALVSSHRPRPCTGNRPEKARCRQLLLPEHFGRLSCGSVSLRHHPLYLIKPSSR
jgi:hypothetical protein